MIPHTLVLRPGLVVHSIYNGYWFWGRPSFVDLWHDLRAVTREIRPDWDLSAPGLREAWDAGDGRPSTASTEPVRDPLAGAVQPARDGPRANSQGARSLLVGQAHDVDRNERVAVLVRQRGDHRVDLACLDGPGRVAGTTAQIGNHEGFQIDLGRAGSTRGSAAL